MLEKTQSPAAAALSSTGMQGTGSLISFTATPDACAAAPPKTPRTTGLKVLIVRVVTLMTSFSTRTLNPDAGKLVPVPLATDIDVAVFVIPDASVDVAPIV